MFFNAEQATGALGSTLPDKTQPPEQNRNLSQKQFGKPPGPEGEAGAAEAGAATAGEGAAAAGGAEAGAAGLAELAPLLLL